MGLEVESIRYAHGPGHTDVCYGYDKRCIFTCGSDGYVRIWTGPDDDDSHSDFVADQALSVACTEDRYLVATNNNYVVEYLLSTKKKEKILFRFSAPVTHVAVSCTSKTIAACSCDMEIQALDCTTNKITTFTGHTAPILGVSLDPSDEYLASSSCDGTLKIWKLSDGSLVKTIHGITPPKNDFFKAVALGRSAWKTNIGSYLAIPKGLEVVVYKRNTWDLVYTLTSSNIKNDLSAVMFSPCGNYVAAASTTGEVIIWEIKCKSEVCYYQDPKKVGISGVAWHADGTKIIFCDRLGRLGVLTGISMEISRHTAPIENNKTEELGNLDDFESERFYDDNDGDEDENCVSLDKIKSLYLKYSDEAEKSRSKSPESTSDSFTKELLTPLPKLQPAFQPSSIPITFEPRCLCYNNVGMVRYYDSDRTIDIQFHDTTFHHSLFLRSFGFCTMASLSSKILCLAVPSIEENLSKFTCISLSSWAGNKEWTVCMPPKEDILAVATAENWVAVATTSNHLRLFDSTGTQKQIISLPGPIVCMSGHERKIFVTCHMGFGLQENQNLGFIIYNVSDISVKVLTPFQSLPMSPKSTLKWLGFTDEGTPTTYDSEGILRFVGHDLLHWLVVWDANNQRKSLSDNYFIIGVSELNQNIRCIFCKSSEYPLVINSPTIVEIPLKIPLCDPNDNKSTAEEKFWRLMFSMNNLQRMSTDSSEIFKNFELPMKQAILKLFGDASNNAEDLRALGLASLMTKKPLEIAIRYANSQGKNYLVEKLSGLKPIDWNYCNTTESILLCSEEKHSSSKGKESFNDEYCNTINTQQDLFEDCTFEKENKSSTTTATSQRTVINPFKKSVSTESDNPKGLKCFDSLSKESIKSNKQPFSINKPLALKLTSNKEKSIESKPKKPTFVEWFSKRKALLSEEYPDISPSELTKVGMKVYKEELIKDKNEKINDNGDSNICESESRKRSSFEMEPLSPTKKKKCLDETE